MKTIDIQNKLALIKEIRYYYTYEGVLNQLESFFQSPFNYDTNYLRCNGLPLNIDQP